MTKAKHTPGPWEWDGKVWDYNPAEEAPWLISGKDTILRGSIKCMAEPDAHLIAAAPDLLDALEALVPLAEAKLYSEHDKIIDAAKSAIAKARGEAI